MIDLSHRTELALVGLAVNHIRQCGAHDFFIVGAQARDILLNFQYSIKTERATLDLDFGVMLESWQQYAALRRALLATGQFVESGEEHRVRFGEMPVDLVPFGGIETVNGTIVWPRGGQQMNTVGFREALAHSVAVALPGNVSVQVAALPTQALLKILTWSELRLERRSKDAQDFRTLVKTYSAVVGEERIASEPEVLAREPFDFEYAGAWLLGRDAGLMHRDAPHFTTSVNSILTNTAGAAGMPTLVASMGGQSLQQNTGLAEWFRDGLQRGLRGP